MPLHAYRRILALSGETPDADTDLAEALSLANNGVPTAEALSLLEKAAAADPKHVRSRFYLAGEAMRQNDFARAEKLWKEVIALSRWHRRLAPCRRPGAADGRGGAVDQRRSRRRRTR